MSIRINQRCDGCGRNRRLHDIESRTDGWIKVHDNKDLCNRCIHEALVGKPSEEKTDGK